MNQTRVVATLGENRVDPILLAERLELTDELDLEPRLRGQGSALARTSSRSGSAQRA
jgi:hypothetical protein